MKVMLNVLLKLINIKLHFSNITDYAKFMLVWQSESVDGGIRSALCILFVSNSLKKMLSSANNLSS